MSHLHLHHPLVRMQTLCGLFGMSRQAWYDEQKRQDKDDLQTGLLLAEVRRLRIDLPSIGIDVLHHKLTDFRQQHGIKIGRDKLANLLRDSGLLIIKKSRRVKTTWSHHRYFKYPNLTIGIKVKVSNSLWVSDITERVNRTIKEDMLQNRGFVSFEAAKEALQRAIDNYNTLRPHGSCDYHTPDQAHQMEGELVKRWRQAKPRNTEKVQQRDSTFVPQKMP